MACAYLLSLVNCSTQNLRPSCSTEPWTKIHVQDVSRDVDGDIISKPPTPDQATRIPEELPTKAPTVVDPASEIFANSLKDVLELYTSRRMKWSSVPGKQGISIPSQRRYLYYWTLLLSPKEAPAHAWAISCFSGRNIGTPKVRLTEIVLRMRETPTVKVNVWRAATFMMGHLGGKSPYNGKGHVWASLARYDDALVDVLWAWEKHTRDEHHIGWRSPRSEDMQDNDLSRVFQGEKWDKGKMVRCFAKFGAVDDTPRENNIKVGHGAHPFRVHT